MQKISEISYVAESGTILPELQWHEEYLITPSGIIFIRSGNAEGTEVNTGQWPIVSDETKLASLFDTLNMVDYAAITRIEPADIPDGGGTESYTIAFSDEKEYSFYFTPGVEYQNGEWIVDPIQVFIKGLDMPTNAENRYRLP